MKKLKLKFLGEQLELELIKAKYKNDKVYYGLVDIKDGEPFCDITVNLPFTNKDVNWIDNDFIRCFDNIRDCKDWLKKNLKIKDFGQGYTSGFYYFTTN